LYCINLPLSWTDDKLRSAFSAYGNVVSTKLLPALPGMPGKGGLVRMSTVEEVSGLPTAAK
jgi:RNA recognition motif-containing protein